MFFRWVLYPLGKLFAGAVYWLFGPLRVEGAKNVPRTGGLLVCANHISDADPPVMFLAVPRPVWFMAKEEVLSMGLIGVVAKLFRSFPVKRGSPDRHAIRRAEELLKKGECVVIFPEGECSESGVMQSLLPGVALILSRAKVPCICAGIIGTSQIIPYGSLRPRKAKTPVRVKFGNVMDISGNRREEILATLTAEIAALAEQPIPNARNEVAGASALSE